MTSVQRSDDPNGVTAEAPLGQTGAGGSSPFLVRASDGRRYWCKALNNPQGSRVPVNDQIVARLGRLVGIGVCEPMLVEIPSDLVGHVYQQGLALEAGWVHGSLAVEGVTETRVLGHHTDDENRKRHAGFVALHDWLVGGDDQWLVSGDEENKYYSHDHGHYFSQHGGPNWTAEALRQDASAPVPLPGADPQHLDQAEMSRLADGLEALTPEEIAEELANIPSSWPVTDEELEAVVGFADQRRTGVATRLRG